MQFFSILRFAACSILVLTLNAQDAGSSTTLLREGKHITFDFTLSKSVLSPTNPLTSFQNGGQFEVRIRKDAFPISTPNCRSDIILRMPWTAPDSVDARTKIGEKRDMYSQIREIVDGSRGQVLVGIDVAPYYKTLKQTPLKVELTECNVFFRQDGRALSARH